MDKPSVKKGIGTVVVAMLLILVPLFSLLVLNASYEVLYLFLVGLVISAILVLGFFVYYSFYYRWARQWLLAGILVGLVLFLLLAIQNELENVYSVMMTPKKYDNYLSLHTHTPYRKNGKTVVLVFSDYQRYGKFGS